MANGILGEIANASKDVGKTAKRTVDTLRGVADYRTRVAELAEFKERKPVRDAEAKLKKQRAEQESEILTEYGDKIKESTALKIENEISNLKKENRWNEMQQIDSALQGIKDEDTYQMVIDNVPPAQLRKYDIEPEKSYKENKTAIKYLADRVQHDIKQRQAMELASLKGLYASQAAANRAGYTPDPTSTLPTDAYFGQIMLSLERDPVFQGFIGMTENMGTSAEFQQSAQMVSGEYEALVKNNADLNRQRAKQGLDPIRMSKQDALETAKLRTKSYLFAGIEEGWFGGQKPAYMDPQEAQQAEYEWRQQVYPQVMRSEEFQNLSIEDQELVLHKMYLKEKMIEHQDAMQKLHGRINSR